MGGLCCYNQREVNFNKEKKECAMELSVKAYKNSKLKRLAFK